MAGTTASITILFVVIIARFRAWAWWWSRRLAAKRSSSPTDTVITFPEDSRSLRRSTRTRQSPDSSGRHAIAYPNGAEVVRSEAFSISKPQIARPAGRTTVGHRSSEAKLTLPAGVTQADSRQLVGHVHDRLHDPDRAVRRAVHVQDPQGARRRGVADRRGRGARRHGRRHLDSRLAARALFSLSRERRRSSRSASTASSPRCCRSGCCSARAIILSSFLKIGTIALLVGGVIVANPEARRRRRSTPSLPEAAARTSTARSFRSASSASCAARSRASTRWSRRARRRR